MYLYVHVSMFVSMYVCLFSVVLDVIQMIKNGIGIFSFA
jgi:hypothetical protein